MGKGNGGGENGGSKPKEGQIDHGGVFAGAAAKRNFGRSKDVTDKGES